VTGKSATRPTLVPGLRVQTVAGFGMLIWIVTEIGFIHALMWAQMIYLITGLLQLVLGFSQLGIVSWLPRLDPSCTRPGSSPMERDVGVDALR